jgi:multidrug efflux pump subunit AcrA (membrane-fusion protein)
MKTRTRVALVAVGVLAVGAVAAPVVVARVAAPTAPRYLTETVVRADVTRTVAATGRVVDTWTYAVVPGADPTLTERAGTKVGTAAAARGYETKDLRVRVGSEVEEGDVLAVVEDADGDETRVRAPFDGVVRSVLTAEGAAAGQVATLGVGGRRVALEVSEYDVARVATGQSARVELNGTGQAFPLRVSSIAPIATDSSGVQTYETLLRGKGWPPRARVGMTVTGTITVQRRRDVLAVPATAITTSDGGRTVSVLDAAGTTQTRAVRVGLTGDRLTEVTRGLEEGERVVTGTDGEVGAAEQPGFVPPAPGGAAAGGGTP